MKKQILTAITLIMVMLALALSCTSCGFLENLFNPDTECTEHTDADSDGLCDKCGAEVEVETPCTEHKDEDKNGLCDNCGAEVEVETPCTEHKDEDKNGLCDNCGATVEVTPPASDKLATPSNVKIEGNTVTWDAVENADYYDIFVNGQFEKTVSETTFTITKTEKGTYSIVICAVSVGNRYPASDESAAVEYVVAKTDLGTPTITLSGDTLAWESVTGATGYDIYANGEKLASVTENTYTLSITEQGVYAISVKATSTSDDYTSESAASNEVSYKVLDKSVYLSSQESFIFDNTADATATNNAWQVSSESFTGGKVLKIAAYITTDAKTATDGRANHFRFTPEIIRANGTIESGGTFAYLNYLSLCDEVNEKIIVVYIIQLPEDFAADDKLNVKYSLSAGMSFSIDKIEVAGAGYNFGADSEYKLFHERADFTETGKLTLDEGEYVPSDMSSLDDIIFLDSKENGNPVVGPAGQIEGYNVVHKACGQTANLYNGQILKFALFLNVTDLAKATDDVALQLSHTMWKSSNNTHLGYASYDVKFSELKEGKVALVVVMQIPENVDASDIYFTWRIYSISEGITVGVDRVVIAGGNYDFGNINGDHEIMVEAASSYAATAPTGTWKPSTIIRTLNKPALTLDEANAKITWSAIPNADKYEVYVDGNLFATVTDGALEYSLATITEPGRYTLKVVASDTTGEFRSCVSDDVVYKINDLSGTTMYHTSNETYVFDNSFAPTYAFESWLVPSTGLKAGQVLKVALYLTTEAATMTDGRANTFYFSPYIVRADGTTEEGGNAAYINYLSIDDPQNRKVLIVHVMQLPDDFKEGDKIQIRFFAGPGMPHTIDKLEVAGADYDFGRDAEYKLFHERSNVMADGKLMYRGGEYTPSTFDSYDDIAFLNVQKNALLSGYAEGYNVIHPATGQTMNIKCGQILKYAFFLDVKTLSENPDDIAIQISNTMWKASNNTHYGYAAYDVKVSELKNGKVLVIVVAEIPEAYDANDIYFTWRFYSMKEGVSVNIDRVMIAGGDYDFGKISGDYEIVVEADSTYAQTTPTKEWQHSTVISRLDAPVLTLTENVVSWNAIENATGYNVYLDGALVGTQTETSYTIEGTTPGNYNVYVEAINSAGAYITSKSNTVVYTIEAQEKPINPAEVFFTSTEQLSFDGSATVEFAPEAWQVPSTGLKAGQVLKVGLYLTVSGNAVTDARTSNFFFSPRIIRADGTVEEGGNFGYLNYLSFDDPQNRKVLIVHIIQLPEDFKEGDKIQVRFFTGAGMSYTVDKMEVSGADYDFGKDAEYKLFHERSNVDVPGKLTYRDGAFTESSLDSYNDITFLNAAINAYQVTGPVEFYQIVAKTTGQTMNIKSGQILKYAFFLDVASFDGTAEDVAIHISNTMWQMSTNSHYGYAEYKVTYSELKNGKIVIIVVAEIPETYDANDIYFTLRFYQLGNVSMTLNRLVVAGGDYDFGTGFGDYEVIVEADSTYAQTTPTKEWTPSTVVTE